MFKLRYKIIILFVSVLIVAISGIVFFNMKNFIEDKKTYLTELNSITAPNISLAVENQLKNLKDQLVVFEDILSTMKDPKTQKKLLESVFEKLNIVKQIDIYDGENLLISVLPSKSDAAVRIFDNLDYNIKVSEYLFVGTKSKAPGYFTKIKNKNYIIWLNANAFQSSFEMARALKVSIVTDDGISLISTNLSSGIPFPEIIRNEISNFLKIKTVQTVLAKEIIYPDGKSRVISLSSIGNIDGAQILVETELIHISKMVKNIMRESTPFIIGILIFIIIIGVIFSAQITKPLEELMGATSHIAQGKWLINIKSKSKDEIGKLIKAFHIMGKKLFDREAELKKAEEELAKYERLASLGKFSAGIAHEIKNPLGSILGYAQILQRNLKDKADETTIKFSNFIIDETKRANKIISDLLIFARQKPPILTPYKSSDLLNHAYELLAPNAQNLKINFHKEIQDENLTINADKDQIFQVFLNMVTNAFQAFESKKDTTEKSVSISLEKLNEFALFKIIDNASGISPENLTKIFDPFFSTKEVGKGSGLGLSMCHGIISGHRGRIEVSSKLNEGTEFRILIPLK